MNIFSRLSGWFGRFGAIGEGAGVQSPVPGASLVDNVANVGVDGALQISTVWACIDRRATILASLPFFVYKSVDGKRELARTSRLFELLHDSPNPRMTPFEFWRAMVLNHDLRGNAYARIDRDANGEALAMWPMPADQVEVTVLPDGEVVYQYTYDNDVAVLASSSVLHINNLSNVTTGMANASCCNAISSIRCGSASSMPLARSSRANTDCRTRKRRPASMSPVSIASVSRSPRAASP